jgi:enoyl-CoA hydratase/carnithine racemase
MSGDPVLTHRTDRVAEITLNRPEAMNAVTVELARRLAHVVAELAEQSDVLVIRGAGGNFSVGGDYRELARLHAEGPDAVRTLFDAFGAACRAIARAPVPVVAAVEGYALAGGFELMQVCDVAIVAQDAVIADNHANVGMLPGGGGSQRLPRLVGRQRAMSHILTGQRISGAQAADWGLAHRAVPQAELAAAVHDVVRSLADKDRVTLARAKALVHDGLAMPMEEGLAMETEAVLAHLGQPGAMDRLLHSGARRA